MIKAKTIDAFTDKPFGGNAAGFAIIEGDYPADSEMLETAKFMGHSETAFVKLMGNKIQLRYFTPAAEVDLCGHATIASFFELYKQGKISAETDYTAITKAGEIKVDVNKDGIVFMDMAEPVEIGELNEEEIKALYEMYGLKAEDAAGLVPAMVSTGLPDIMMPVKSKELLANLKPDMDAITELSRRLNVVGVHAFTLDTEGDGPNVTAHARNFAPLYDIPEEAATGTSNGALSYYLFKRGFIKAGETNLIIQGEAMGRPSKINTVLYETDDGVKIRVGGQAAARE